MERRWLDPTHAGTGMTQGHGSTLAGHLSLPGHASAITSEDPFPRHWIYLLLHMVVFVLGVLLVQGKGAVGSGVGASLIAAAVVGWVLFVWVLLNEEQARRLDVLVGSG